MLAVRINQSGIAKLAKKDVALLTLQSLVYLPALIFLTKSTVIVLAVVTVCGLFYVRSLPSFRPAKAWTLVLIACTVSAAWSITPYQSLERAAKFGLFVVLLVGLSQVVNRWSADDRHRLSELGLKAWWISLVIMLPLIFFKSEIRAAIDPVFLSDGSIYIFIKISENCF